MAAKRKPVAKDKTRAETPAPSALLEALKRGGPMSMRKLAASLGITYEAVRQQVAELSRAGWVTGQSAPTPDDSGSTAQVTTSARKPGPASRQYRLSAAGEHLFPKHYDTLSAELVQQVLETYGAKAVREILGRMTDARVRRWAPLLKSMSLKEKLKTLCSLYEDRDAYMEVQWQESAPALIERNCPFLNVAREHPAICSVSVNTLERLLGYQVVREQRFQAGDGRCVFRVRLDRPRAADEPFTLERER